jgi:peroxiredoxin
MWERFESAGVSVAGISVDSVEQNQAMVDKLLLPFELLSDPESRVIREWGVLNEAEHDIAKPAIFGIRPDRSIGYQYVGVDFTDRPDDSELFAGIAEVTDGQG